MSSIMKKEMDKPIDRIVPKTQNELRELRCELDRCRGILDSAHLLMWHEFVKPLTSISGYIELLEENLRDVIGEDEQRYFIKVREAIGRLEDLIESFVKILRLQGCSKQKEDLEIVCLYRLVEKVRARFGENADLVGNEVSSDLPPLFLNRISIEVILENLISNALNHSGDCEPVRVTASLEEKGDGTSRERLLTVNVADRGSGISDDEIEKVFTPFYRGNVKKNPTGTGLGLPLVKSIISFINGEVHIRSKLGEGTTVDFKVPVPVEIQDQPARVG